MKAKPLTVVVDAAGNATLNWLPKATMKKRLKHLENCVRIQKRLLKLGGA